MGVAGSGQTACCTAWMTCRECNSRENRRFSFVEQGPEDFFHGQRGVAGIATKLVVPRIAIFARLRGPFVAWLLVVAMISGGCGRRGPAPIRVEVPPAVTQLRGLLEGYAKSGELDSGIVAIREQIDVLRGTDAAKADVLAAELPKLESSKGAAAVKKQAEAMLGKL